MFHCLDTFFRHCARSRWLETVCWTNMAKRRTQRRKNGPKSTLIWGQWWWISVCESGRWFCHIFLKTSVTVQAIFVNTANFHEIDPHINRHSVLQHWTVVVCKNCPQNDPVSVGWDVTPYSLSLTIMQKICCLLFVARDLNCVRHLLQVANNMQYSLRPSDHSFEFHTSKVHKLCFFHKILHLVYPRCF